MRTLLLLCLVLLAACAPSSDYRPAVELGGADTARYETDLRDCKKVAARDRYAPVFVGVLQGAVIGVALGTAVVGIGGGNVGLAQSYGAISGTVAGGAVGASQVREPPTEKKIVDQCLRNNGYRL
jgi:outer membrane lipoprotein SlyB